jgi:hypothetical protein
MSDVELYWSKIAERTGDPRTWQQLEPQLQVMVIQSINLLLSVLNTNRV